MNHACVDPMDVSDLARISRAFVETGFNYKYEAPFADNIGPRAFLGGMLAAEVLRGDNGTLINHLRSVIADIDYRQRGGAGARGPDGCSLAFMTDLPDHPCDE